MLRNVLIICGVFILVNLFNFAAGAAESERDTITMRVVAANPSRDKIQKVPVKIYLPEEVGPNDIVGKDILDVEYDSERSIYYVFNDGVELKPGEIRVFQIELKDVWVISKEKLDYLKKQTDFVLTRFENSEYYENAQKLAEVIYKSLDTINITQNSDTASRKKHIGIYRNNVKLINQIEKDIATLERQLTLVSALPVPEVLEKIKVKTEAPTKSATWMIIFIIMIFLGMLTAVFFLTWHTQSRFTKNIASAAKKFISKEKKGSE